MVCTSFNESEYKKVKEILDMYFDGENRVIDARDYMENGAGRFVDPSSFKAVRDFLYGGLTKSEKEEYSGTDFKKVTNYKLPAGEYTFKQILESAGVKTKPMPELGLSQYDFDDGKGDYISRAFIEGSTSFTLSEDTIFYVHANGRREVKARVIPRDRNFDFQSHDKDADRLNKALEALLDPNKKGHTVNFEYINENEIPFKTYTSRNFMEVINKRKKYYDDEKGRSLLFAEHYAELKFYLDKYIKDNNLDSDEAKYILELIRAEPLAAPLAVGSETVCNSVRDKFSDAQNFTPRRDPLTLDLNNNGIETLALDKGVIFDFNGDGIKTGTGWIAPSDGFLVLDKDGNGTIDNGNELFGVDTIKSDGTKAVDGFDALRDLDSNGDGVFDRNDEMFSKVKVWQDLNSDGISQANELKTLDELGIVGINLDATKTNIDSNGNIISAIGTFIREDGSIGEANANQSVVANLDLTDNPFYREFTDKIALDEHSKSLPDLKGSGAVRDLREATMLNQNLKQILTEYAAANTRGQQLSLVDTMIAEWSAPAKFETFDKKYLN
ncbi:hypothetical protein VQ643_13225 [Pseudomonas sp. F1_0610]|uniref:hypothetical protein n=1 Tax=Pseudomonas sp. F1_0610 TaxID=3114284 RepID=UPI0039C10A60